MARVVIEDVDFQEDWICGSCKRVCPGMDGPERRSLKCTNCGHEKTDKDPWVTPDDALTAPALTGEKAQWARLGENLVCSYCSAENRADEVICIECGASLKDPKEETKPSPVVVTPRVTPAPPPSVARKPVQTKASVERASPVTSAPSAPRTSFTPSPTTSVSIGVPQILGGLGILAGIAALIALIVWGLSPNKAVARVDSITWTRTATLFEQHPYPGQGWQDQAPAGAFAFHNCRSLQRGTHACNPHQVRCRYLNNCNCTGGGTERCNPRSENEDYNCREVVDRDRCTTTVTSNRNGSGRRRTVCETKTVCDHRRVTRWSQCPVPRVCERCPTQTCDTEWDRCPTMATYCNFMYMQWDQMDHQVVSGHDHSPQWPVLRDPNPLFLHRVDQDESYEVRWRNTEDYSQTWALTTNPSQFSRYNAGQRWDVTWSRLGGVSPIRLLPQGQ